MALILSIVVCLIAYPFLHLAQITRRTVFFVTQGAVLGHLMIDLFTYNSDCTANRTHLYFWPVWDQSFNLNCVFNDSTAVFVVRVLVEWAICFPISLTIVTFRWYFRKENPFEMLFPAHWVSRALYWDDWSDVPKKLRVRLCAVSILFSSVIVYFIMRDFVSSELDVWGALQGICPKKHCLKPILKAASFLIGNNIKGP